MDVLEEVAEFLRDLLGRISGERTADELLGTPNLTALKR